MKVYFGASISLNREMLPIYQEIVKEIENLGNTVLSEHVVDPNLTKGEWQKQYIPKDLFKRETDRLDKSDVMVAEVTSPSWGTAFLIEHALAAGKPVLALYYKESEMPLPMMIAGHPELYVAHYTKGNIRVTLKKNLDYFASMSHRKGKLVVIDGTDGSGKGTQTELLLTYLDEHKVKNKYIDFPRYYTSFHGKMVGRLMAGEFGSKDSANPHLSSLFYALDRLTARDEIVDWLEEGNTIVANRYTTSSLAFQTARVPKAEREEFLQWLYDMEYKEHKLPKEDLVIFLYVPVSISQKLIEKKAGSETRRYISGKGKDINEADVAYQKEVLNLYLELSKRYKHWEVIKCTDSRGKLYSIEAIHKKIIATLKKRDII